MLRFVRPTNSTRYLLQHTSTSRLSYVGSKLCRFVEHAGWWSIPIETCSVKIIKKCCLWRSSAYLYHWLNTTEWILLKNYHQLTLPKPGISWQLFVEVFFIEFRNNLWDFTHNDMYKHTHIYIRVCVCVRVRACAPLHKVGCTVGQHHWKRNYLTLSVLHSESKQKLWNVLWD